MDRVLCSLHGAHGSYELHHVGEFGIMWVPYGLV